MWILLFPFFLVYHFFWFALAHTSYIMHFYGPRDPWTAPTLLKSQEPGIFETSQK
jgi:hypothetical protein